MAIYEMEACRCIGKQGHFQNQCFHCPAYTLAKLAKECAKDLDRKLEGAKLTTGKLLCYNLTAAHHRKSSQQRALQTRTHGFDRCRSFTEASCS